MVGTLPRTIAVTCKSVIKRSQINSFLGALAPFTHCIKEVALNPLYTTQLTDDSYLQDRKFNIAIASCAPVVRMFFNFEADEPQEDQLSPTTFSSRPILLERLEQSARNSVFDAIESIQTFHVGSEGRSMKGEKEQGVQNGGVTHDSEGSKKQFGVIEVARNSLHGLRMDSRG
jgi:hypothetical protein